MKTLTIETSLGNASVCISDGSAILSYSREEAQGKQAEKLFYHISLILAEAGIEYKDLGAVTSSIGPGSFTSIRIGMAAAKGICIGLNIPFIGVSTLETLAYKSISGEGRALSLIDAGRGQFYSQKFIYSNNIFEPLSQASSILYEDVISQASEIDKIICNKENVVFAEIINKQVIISDVGAKDCANLSDYKRKNNLIDYSANHSPLYLREPDAKPGKKFLWNY
ncbi:MAG TPA: tRNA (adenosine(37)-N6)-threonylcarbamoyltransferase complex dimerization subunit type 1 TsaB [Alphaproteobacteria bacterium]|nr:tRNA (adenosine(37)-N6)-threonylcarbamoyltransferase complex dimerization subunit type 1 TsaB [Alphaproteobacteria bacterium]